MTPLASIIGSGFLISLPLLAEDLGAYAICGIAALLTLAYLIGAVIRFNIAYGEPLFEDRGLRALGWLERSSHLALGLAYFISVTYYLTLMAAFLLKGLGMTDPLSGKLVTTAILIFIGVYGLLKGLHGLEDVEEYAVSIKLGVIAALLVGLLSLNLETMTNGQWLVNAVPPRVTWHSIQVVLGLLIVVQGFETSRFLRGEYSAELRIRTMRYGQLISTVIYVSFFALATITIGHTSRINDVAAITDMLLVVATVVPFMLTVGAVCAQLSAAVADAIGAAGLISEVTSQRIDRRHAYPFIAAVGVALTWSIDVYEIIALASKAFALFYAMQCVVAVAVAVHAKNVRLRAVRVTGYAILTVISIVTVVFGIAAKAG